MIPYIYLITFAAIALLGISFYFKEYAVGAMASMLTIAIGVYIIRTGLVGVDDFITRIFAIILIGVGAYILIRGGLESIS